MRKSVCRETATETIYNNKIVKMINILRDLLGTYVNCPCHSISEKPIASSVIHIVYDKTTMFTLTPYV